MVNRFTIVRPGEPLPKGLLPDNESPQQTETTEPAAEAAKETTVAENPVTPPAAPASDRFQLEMYKAMEILGRKLERAEEENSRLASRLAQIEAATTIDEKTGRFHVPALTGAAAGASAIYNAPLVAKSTFAASAFSILVAFFALGLAIFNQPHVPAAPAGVVLNKDQLAALNALTAEHMTGLKHQAVTPNDNIQANKWQSVENFADAPAADTDASDKAKVVFDKNPAIAEGLKPETDPALIIKPAKEKAAAVPVVPVDIVPQQSVHEAVAAAPQEEQAEAPVAEASGTYNTVERDANLPANLQKLEKRAFDGVAEAQHDLATVYASGKTVPQDYKRAVYWFSRAADGGIANAHYNLGVMFQQGLGLKKDAAKAIGWYKSAAELGHPEAMYNLGIAYIDGVGVAQNVERGSTYFKRAAAAGVAQAAYNLGVLYESGFMGAIDLDQALHWYTQAKNKKHAEANEAIARIKKLKQSASKLPPNLPADAVAPIDMSVE